MPHTDNLRQVNAVLTGLAQGYQNMEMVFQHLFPVVEADKESGKIPKFGKEHFRLNKTERAMRAKSNRLNWTMDNPIAYTMTEHDLEFPIDLREIEEGAEILNLQQYGTMVTSDGIAIRLEKQAADIAQNDTLYPTGNKVSLTGTDKWTDLTNATPIDDIDTAKAAIRGKVAKHPNVAVFGYDAWRLFKNHPSVIGRLQYGGEFKGVITEALAAQILEIEKVVVGKAIYVDDDGAAQDIWADNVILAYVPTSPAEQRNVYEPSYGYSVRKTGRPEVDTYDDNGGKIQVVRNTDIITQVLCGADAGYIIKDVR